MSRNLTWESGNMPEGFYSISFTGEAGSGFGILVFSRGVIVGADAAGATYDGTYTEPASGQGFDILVMMRAPAGVRPVQTGIPLTSPAELPIKASLSPQFDSGNPILLGTPLGPVNIVFKKIRGSDYLMP